jgi:predicted nucleotide-binding protein
VFIVHGHDDLTKEAAARFIERLNLEAIILHEQPNKGLAIIEKLERHADVGFALVLLTPDDVGAARANATNLQPRARQNVIFEMGMFIGQLGRRRVCTLYKGSVELPSDYQGVIYIQMDDGGGWRAKVAKELKEAGFAIDTDNVL